MKKVTILLVTILLVLIVALLFYACEKTGESSDGEKSAEEIIMNITSYKVRPSVGINFELDYDNYPEIVTTEYTFLYVSKLPAFIFDYPDKINDYIFDATKESIYPKLAQTKEEVYGSIENGSADIAVIEMIPGEEKNETKFDYTLIGRIGIAFTTSINNKVGSITKEQAIKIYRGEITDWSELDGDPGKINVIDFELPTGERRINVPERALLAGEKSKANILVGGNLNKALGLSEGYHFPYEYMEYGENSNYTIYADDVSYTVTALSVESEFETVKPLKVDGMLPDGEKIANGEYPFIIECYAVTVKGNLDVTVNNFVNWLSNGEENEVLKVNYGIGNKSSDLISMWKDQYFHL